MTKPFDENSPDELRSLATRIEALPPGLAGGDARHLNTLAAYALGWSERQCRAGRARRLGWHWFGPDGEGPRSMPGLIGKAKRGETLAALRAKADRLEVDRA